MVIAKFALVILTFALTAAGCLSETETTTQGTTALANNPENQSTSLGTLTLGDNSGVSGNTMTLSAYRDGTTIVAAIDEPMSSRVHVFSRRDKWQEQVVDVPVSDSGVEFLNIATFQGTLFMAYRSGPGTLHVLYQGMNGSWTEIAMPPQAPSDLVVALPRFAGDSKELMLAYSALSAEGNVVRVVRLTGVQDGQAPVEQEFVSSWPSATGSAAVLNGTIVVSYQSGPGEIRLAQGRWGGLPAEGTEIYSLPAPASLQAGHIDPLVQFVGGKPAIVASHSGTSQPEIDQGYHYAVEVGRSPAWTWNNTGLVNLGFNAASSNGTDLIFSAIEERGHSLHAWGPDGKLSVLYRGACRMMPVQNSFGAEAVFFRRNGTLAEVFHTPRLPADLGSLGC